MSSGKYLQRKHLFFTRTNFQWKLIEEIKRQETEKANERHAPIKFQEQDKKTNL
jgi:hypothetical protein